MACTIILGTQRTGSTLLCCDLASLGGFGKPGEHFLDWLKRASAGERMSPDALAEILETGRDAGGAVGVKLMADYLPRLATAWLGNVHPEAHVISAGFFDALEVAEGPVALVRIRRRDRFDQALSRYLAVATGVYFKTNGGDVRRSGAADRESEEAVLASYNPQRIEKYLRDIERENAFLDQVIAAQSRAVLEVAYEDLVEDRETVLAKCCAHAGRDVPAKIPARWLEKVVDSGLRDLFRERAETVWRERSARGARLPETARALGLGTAYL